MKRGGTFLRLLEPNLLGSFYGRERQWVLSHDKVNGDKDFEANEPLSGMVYAQNHEMAALKFPSARVFAFGVLRLSSPRQTN